MKQRYINTKFWSDNWIVELDYVERYLFLYLLTNEHTNIAGIYELPLTRMAQETGIDKEMLPKILRRFEKDGKVVYRKGWVRMVNFQKHQDVGSENIKKGIESSISLVPKDILDTLYIPLPYPSNYPNPNINLNLNPNPTAQGGVGNPIAEIIFLFKGVNQMVEKLYGSPPQRKAVERMLKVFGREKLEDIIRVLPQINKKQYWPKSTTPVQLENNIAIYKAKNDEDKAKRSGNIVFTF